MGCWAVGLQPINPFLAYLSTASADGSGPVPAVRLPVHEAKPHLAATASTEAWGKLDDDSTVMSHHATPPNSMPHRAGSSR